MSAAVVIAENMSETCLKINAGDVTHPAELLTNMEQSEAVFEDDVKKVEEENTIGENMRSRKRKKTRRGKPKRRKLKPYSRLWQDDKPKSNNRRGKLYAYGQPEAPYNTTQFLMADHNDLQELDDHLRAVPVVQRPPRARDSSFSIDSDDDYFYSSPEDEGEFLSKEFCNTYEDLHAERISAMSKTQLIQECLMLEEKVDMLEARLKANESSRATEEMNAKNAGAAASVMNAQNIETYKQEIEKLRLENEQLRRENDHLRCSYLKRNSPTVSSVDSESDSSSCSSDSDSSSEDEVDNVEACQDGVNVEGENEDETVEVIGSDECENTELVCGDKESENLNVFDEAGDPENEKLAVVKENSDDEANKLSAVVINDDSLRPVPADLDSAAAKCSSTSHMGIDEMDSAVIE